MQALPHYPSQQPCCSSCLTTPRSCLAHRPDHNDPGDLVLVVSHLCANELGSQSEIIFNESGVHRYQEAILAPYGCVQTYDTLQRVDDCLSMVSSSD